MEDCCRRVLPWLRQLRLTEVHSGDAQQPGTSSVVGAVLGSAKRHTWQQSKAFKHRAQIEAITGHCLRCMPADCETVVEMGAGQAVLGHTVSIASGLPLVAIERRGNTDAFESVEIADQLQSAVPAAYHVQADIADEEAWPESGNMTLLAKHLCGHSSDIAVDNALRMGERLSLLCLAPCCHATMTWTKLSPASQRWFLDLGFNGAWQEFSLLVDVIRLWRAGRGASGKFVPCARWRLRDFLEDGEIEVLGRKACRAIDEARLARLRAGGFDVALVEYCDAAYTPDNVLLLAAPQGRLPSFEPGQVTSLGAGAAGLAAGIYIEIDPTGSPTLQQRLAGYLIGRPTAFPALASVLPLQDAASSRVPGLICSAADGEAMLELLGQLAACPLLKRIVCRFLPFSSVAPNLDDLVGRVSAVLSRQDTPGSVRVSSRPRDLEQQLCTALGPALTSPTQFTHMLFVASHPADEEDQRAAGVAAAAAEDEGAAESAGDGDARRCGGALRYALVPRAVQDMSAWQAERKTDDAVRAFWRCAEVAMRWPARLKMADALVVWTDSKAPVAWAEAWSGRFLKEDCPTLELRLVGNPKEGPRRIQRKAVRGVWGPGGARASVLICDVGCGGEEAVEALEKLFVECTHGPDPVLAEEGLVILRLRCGKKPRAVKRWHREMAQLIETKLKCRHVELLHLLSDRDPERTAVFAWDCRPANGAGH